MALRLRTRAAKSPPPLLCRWDLDKTYLRSEFDTLRQLCGQALESRVTTTTVGVGEGFDEDLLAGMAQAVAGPSRDYFITHAVFVMLAGPVCVVGVYGECCSEVAGRTV